MTRLRATIVLLICFGITPLAACSNRSSTVVPWHGYDHLWSAPTQRRPFIILKCKFSDVSSVPSGFDETINRFLTLAGAGAGNMLDYFADISYGAVSLAGDRVFGWYAAPYPSATLIGRARMVRDCANSVPQDDIDFSAYYGIILVTNAFSGGGACYDGQKQMSIHGQDYPMACVVFDTKSFFGAFAAHEIGHGLGFPHSYDNTLNKCDPNSQPGEYKDPWDMMSALCTYQFVGANYPNPYDTAATGRQKSDGPGMSVPNLLYMGWIPSQSEIPAYKAFGAPQTFTLAALSHPKSPGVLGVRLYPNINTPGDYFTVEYRENDGWDAGLPEDAVLIHEFKKGVASADTPFSYLQRNRHPYQSEWLPGQAWTDPTHTVQVCVTSFDPSSHDATIQVGVPSPFCSSGPRVKILAPANGTQVVAGAPVQLSASATTFSGLPLPDAAVKWQANGQALGSGRTLTTSLSSPGTYTITVKGTDSDGASATDSITLLVTAVSATPPPLPTVNILSPTSGETYSLGSSGGTMTLVLSAQGSTGVVKYAWSDSRKLFTDNKANDTLTLTPSETAAPCSMTGTPDVITVKVTDSHGQTASANVTILITRICVN